MQIAGSGFAPGEFVTLRVTHADGTAEAGMGHDDFMAVPRLIRQRPAGIRQPSPLVGNVFCQPAFAQRFEHAGHGTRRNAQGLGQFARRGRLPLVSRGNLIDPLIDLFAWMAFAPLRAEFALRLAYGALEWHTMP